MWLGGLRACLHSRRRARRRHIGTPAISPPSDGLGRNRPKVAVGAARGSRSLRRPMGAIATSGLPARSRTARLQRLLTPTDAERRERARAPRRARSRRDWIVDTACFLVAVGGGIYGPGALLENGATPSSTVAALIVAAGVLACLAIWLRRRWPVGVALLTVVLGGLSPAAGGAALIGLFSVAVHRRSVVAIADRRAGDRPAARVLLAVSRRHPVLGQRRAGDRHPGGGRRLGHVHPLPARAHARAARAHPPGRGRARPARAARRARRSAPASPARCTTCWPTASRC